MAVKMRHKTKVRRYAPTAGAIPSTGRTVAPTTTVGGYGVAPVGTAPAATGSRYDLARRDLESSFGRQIESVNADRSMESGLAQQLVSSGLMGTTVGFAPKVLAGREKQRLIGELLARQEAGRSAIYQQEAGHQLAEKQLSQQGKLAKEQMNMQQRIEQMRNSLEVARLNAYRNQLSRYNPTPTRGGWSGVVRTSGPINSRYLDSVARIKAKHA